MDSTTRRGFFGILGAALAAVGLGRRGEPQGRVIESFELTGLHVHPSAPRYTRCPLPFKGQRCGYDGAERECACTFASCRELGNEVRFGGIGIQFEDYDPALYSAGPTLKDCMRRGQEERAIVDFSKGGVVRWWPIPLTPPEVGG